jgi:hypothetical protein
MVDVTTEIEVLGNRDLRYALSPAPRDLDIALAISS